MHRLADELHSGRINFKRNLSFGIIILRRRVYFAWKFADLIM